MPWIKTDQGDATYDCFTLIYYALREKKNDMRTSCFNDLFPSLLKKVYEKGAFFPKKGIRKGLDLGAEPPRIKLFLSTPGGSHNLSTRFSL